MTDQERQVVEDHRIALVEATDAMNRLSAVLERNTLAQGWLTAVLQWHGEAWWRRGPAPKWTGTK